MELGRNQSRKETMMNQGAKPVAFSTSRSTRRSARFSHSKRHIIHDQIVFGGHSSSGISGNTISKCSGSLRVKL